MNTSHKVVGNIAGVCFLCEGLLVITDIDTREHNGNIFNRHVLTCQDCGVVFTGQWT